MLKTYEIYDKHSDFKRAIYAYVNKRPIKPEFFDNHDEDSLANPTIQFFASQYYVAEDRIAFRENAAAQRGGPRRKLTLRTIADHLGGDKDEDSDMEDTGDQDHESDDLSDDEDEEEASNENFLRLDISGVDTCAISKNVLLVYDDVDVAHVFNQRKTWKSRLNDIYTCHEYWEGKVMYIEEIQKAKEEIFDIYETSGFAKLDSRINDARKAYRYYLAVCDEMSDLSPDDELVDSDAVAQKYIYDKYKKDKTVQEETNLKKFIYHQGQAYDVMYKFIDKEEHLSNRRNSDPHEVYHHDVDQALSFELPPDICDKLAASSPKLINGHQLMTIVDKHKDDFTLSALITDTTIANPGAIMTVIKWHARNMDPPSSLLYYNKLKPAFVDVTALLDRESRSELRISVGNYLSLLPWIKTEKEWDCLIDTKHDETPDPEFVPSTSELTKDKLGTYGQLQVKMLLVMLKRIFGDDKTFALYDIGHGEGEFLSNVREYAKKLGTKINELHGVEFNDTYRESCSKRFKSYALQDGQAPTTDYFYDNDQTPSYVKLDYAKVDSEWKIGPLLDLDAVDPITVCYMYDTYFNVLRYDNNHKELLKALCGYADILQVYSKNESVDAFVTHVPLQQLILFDNPTATPNAVYNVKNGVEAQHGIERDELQPTSPSDASDEDITAMVRERLQNINKHVQDLKVTMHDKVAAAGRQIVETPADGNCMYHAVHYGLHGRFDEAEVAVMRTATVVELTENKFEYEPFFATNPGGYENEIKTVQADGGWGNEFALAALATAIG
ncbi:hypothetical protein CYMTET_24517 [Cymbomonas tetramitiformis]|uniref:OTU domain-containing protein n=1 Tax=Cymbomonas tetramitiformis TaxID=36881 RepID=A0AAE0FWG7_9CHLO|nr:hypothetical protein CYMTET_24517 [Cymbomonas tetramitiformis]